MTGWWARPMPASPWRSTTRPRPLIGRTTSSQPERKRQEAKTGKISGRRRPGPRTPEGVHSALPGNRNISGEYKQYGDCLHNVDKMKFIEIDNVGETKQAERTCRRGWERTLRKGQLQRRWEPCPRERRWELSWARRPWPWRPTAGIATGSAGGTAGSPCCRDDSSRL